MPDFWAILKWESEADDKYAARWIILIAYLIGLSIGVHLLNLLAIPAVVFYNKLNADCDRLVAGYESFADEFSTILSRQLDS